MLKYMRFTTRHRKRIDVCIVDELSGEMDRVRTDIQNLIDYPQRAQREEDCQSLLRSSPITLTTNMRLLIFFNRLECFLLLMLHLVG